MIKKIILVLGLIMVGCSTQGGKSEGKNVELENYKAKYKGNDAAPGWEAIDLALDKLYPNQQPKHYGTAIKYMLGGPDPIDGISVYDAGDHIHLVTYGFSSLYYEEESVGKEFSKFGFELTMRLKKGEDPVWAMNMLQNIAGYVFINPAHE